MSSIEEIQAREAANPKIINRSRIEGAVIRGFAKRARLSTYVDFGCWVGLLAEQALKDNDFERAVLVDPVAACLTRSSARINPRVKAELHNCAIVPVADDRPFGVPEYDTSCAGFGQPGSKISVAQVEVCQFLKALHIDLGRTYLKVDVEGMDFEIARSVSTAKMLPRVLHIEFMQDADFDRLHALLKDSYSFPDKKPGHAFYSMALTRERGVLIGFDPDVAYSGPEPAAD
jgi:hypothetical protein